MEEQKIHKSFSFRRYAWRQFRRNRPALLSLIILLAMVLVALFADLIANGQPLYANYRGKTFYPAFTSIFNATHTDSTLNPETGKYESLQFDVTDWRRLPLEKVIWAPIAYSPDQPDRYNADYTAPTAVQEYKDAGGNIVPLPYKLRHHLGTNRIGLDLASGLVHGTRISLRVGIISMGIASIIGIILGALAGFYGDTRLYTYRGKYYLVWIAVIIGFFYAFIVRKYELADAAEQGILAAFKELFVSLLIMAVVIAIAVFTGKLFRYVPFLNKKVNTPVDSIISRAIEILDSLPRLLLILTIAALFREKSLFLVMAIIGLTSWTGIARLTRAEFLRNRNLDYVQAAQALGYKDWRIVFRHTLSNAIAPVFVAIAFGIASAILIESSLSFLGIGVPDEVVTWGSLLSASRQQFDAWWMVVYPGLAIFLTVTIYNLIGEGLRDALDPRLKQ